MLARCWHDAGRDLRNQRAEAVRDAETATHSSYPRVVGYLTMCLENLADGISVPVLLIGPDGEELGHHRISVQLGHEEVTEVADRVVLDVVHIAKASQCLVIEGVIAKLGEVDPCEIECMAPFTSGGPKGSSWQN